MAPRTQKLLRTLHWAFNANELRVSTWLALGACLQLVLLITLPPRLSALPAIFVLFYRFITAVQRSRGVYETSYKEVKRGRWTAPLLPSVDANGDVKDAEGVTVFVLGVHIAHPLGRAASGGLRLNPLFNAMWSEAARNRVKWGYLGHTRSLNDCFYKGDGMIFIWLSYWRDPKGLQAFASCVQHRIAATQYQKNEYPYMGIMHETYFAPRNAYESIYLNFPAFGMGEARFATNKATRTGTTTANGNSNSNTTAKVVVEQGGHDGSSSSIDNNNNDKGFQLASPLMAAQDAGHADMFQRMGKKYL